MVIVTGTDTNIGKTLVSSWLCLHTGFGYFKPIQTGLSEGRDSDIVASLSNALTYPETYCFQDPVSPHLAAESEGCRIDIQKINLPVQDNLVIEGAGGVYVPVNEHALMLDLFKHLNQPVILVASSRLGTINHTLLSIKAIRDHKLTLLGVVMVGEDLLANQKAIQHYGQTEILASLPWLDDVSQDSLRALAFPVALQNILGRKS